MNKENENIEVLKEETEYTATTQNVYEKVIALNDNPISKFGIIVFSSSAVFP